MVVGACSIVVMFVLIAELWLDDLIAEPARRFIERELSAATGLEARIRGVVDLDFVPNLHIEATQQDRTIVQGGPHSAGAVGEVAVVDHETFRYPREARASPGPRAPTQARPE